MSENQSQHSQNDNNSNQGGEGEQPQTVIHSLPLRDYYENSLTPVLLEGLRQLGAQRPENPIKWLGQFLLDNDKDK